MSRRGVFAGLICLLAVSATLGAVAALRMHADLSAAAPSGEGRRFLVEPGTPCAQIARDLEAGRLIRDARAFSWLARWRDVERRVHAGEYEVSPAWDSGRILDALVTGDVRTYAVSIPEGLRAAQVAARLERAGLCDAKAFLAIVRDPQSAERPRMS